MTKKARSKDLAPFWDIGGNMSSCALSSTAIGVLDWAVYMGAAVQITAFGFMKEEGRVHHHRLPECAEASADIGCRENEDVVIISHK